MAKKKEKKKGSCLKTILIVLAVLIIIGIAASMGGGEKSFNETEDKQQASETVKEDAVAEEPQVTTYKAGMYKIGTDMPAGEYLIESNSMEYLEVATDSSGELDSIITNENFTNRIYISVSDGQYLKFGGTATPVAEAPAYVAENGYYPEGQYLVGKDIPAGEYKISVTDNAMGMGYIEVSSGSSGTLDSIITNSNIEMDTYQTISDGQYLTLSGAEIKGQ